VNTCDTCKHWEPPKEGHDHRDMGTCQNPLLQQEGPNCLSAGEVWSQHLEPSTGPKFSCCHHDCVYDF
jgi:hypothetical protein